MIEIRALATHAEFARALELQRIIWGFPELELVPLRLFVVASRIGGMALGAFENDNMIAFLVALPGMKHHAGWPPEPYLHSHMLGVLSGYRDRGVGRMLKLEQRKIALEQGIRLIEWTFDPFETKNAYFNIKRLGAVVRRHVRNMYGATSSPLHGGLPTDRLVAEWWIASRHVERALAGEPAPFETRLKIPVEEKSPSSQSALATAFETAAAQKLAASGFERAGRGGSYLLSAWDPNL